MFFFGGKPVGDQDLHHHTTMLRCGLATNLGGEQVIIKYGYMSLNYSP